MQTSISSLIPMPPASRYTLQWAFIPLFILIALFAGITHAETLLDMRDGASATAKLSLKDPTRLRIDGLRITDVRGSSLRTKDNPAGVLTASLDEDKGDLYLLPVTPQSLFAATSIFVSTARSTYTLVLVPMDIPADTIVIRDRVTLAAPSGNKRLPTHERELIDLLKTVATSPAPANLYAVEINQPVHLWQEARFVLRQRYEGNPRWVVEVFDLTNISASPMVLDEREFLTTGIAAVALEQTILGPGETVPVRIVREALR